MPWGEIIFSLSLLALQKQKQSRIEGERGKNDALECERNERRTTRNASCLNVSSRYSYIPVHGSPLNVFTMHLRHTSSTILDEGFYHKIHLNQLFVCRSHVSFTLSSSHILHRFGSVQCSIEGITRWCHGAFNAFSQFFQY